MNSAQTQPRFRQSNHLATSTVPSQKLYMNASLNTEYWFARTEGFQKCSTSQLYRQGVNMEFQKVKRFDPHQVIQKNFPLGILFQVS